MKDNLKPAPSFQDLDRGATSYALAVWRLEIRFSNFKASLRESRRSETETLLRMPAMNYVTPSPGCRTPKRFWGHIPKKSKPRRRKIEYTEV
jgi:hypothetical protein